MTARESQLPAITVVVATRNRAETVAATVASVANGDWVGLELVVVDQSDDDSTRGGLCPFLTDPRVRYLRSGTSGVSAARNEGIEAARNELIAITDDDCVPSTRWLRDVAEAFDYDERIAVVFGNVLPAPHDAQLGFVPAHVRSEAILLDGIGDAYGVQGMSACMGLRRSAWQALGGFDLVLGAGAPLKSGAEVDLAIRALAAGYCVLQTPRVAVVHHGFRSWDEGRTLVQRYWYGTGAMLAKHAKSRTRGVSRLAGRLAWRWAFGRSAVAVSLGRRAYRLTRLLAFVRGFAKGLATPVDRATNRFRY